jgi:hypothetical protein
MSISAVILGLIIRIMNEIMTKPMYFLSHPVRCFSKIMIYAKEWQKVFEKKANTKVIVLA